MEPVQPDPNEQQPATIRELGISWIRTGVPVLWGYVLVFLAARAPAVHDIVDTPYVFAAATGAVTMAWYWVMRKVEHKIPAWLTRLVLGANTSPRYYADREWLAQPQAIRREVAD